MTAVEHSVLTRLRAETRSLHDSAERAEFQQRLLMGRVSAGEYSTYLGQLYLVHQALESALRCNSELPPIASVLRDHQFKLPELSDDLAHFDVAVDCIAPLEATAALVDEIERVAGVSEVALLGFHYVLEGSTNGGKYLARSIARGLGLTGRTGVSYLDPYGDRLHERWGEFKQNMEAAPISPIDADAVVEAAKAMFLGMIRISEQMTTAAALVGV